MPLRKNLNTHYHAHRYKKKKDLKNIKYLGLFVLLLSTSFFIGKKVFVKGESKEKKESVVEQVAEKIIPVKEKKVSNPAPLLAEIESYLATQTGEYGYTIKELDKDGQTFGNRQNNYYVAASTVKVGVAAYVEKQIELGKATPDQLLTYTSADYEGGTGSLQGSKVGTKYKASYLLERMLKVSDNIATNIFFRTFGRSNIQAYLTANGLSDINLTQNQVTPAVMAELLAKVYRAEIVSTASAQEIQNLMKKSIDWNTRIDGGVPESVQVAHKIGTQTAAMSDIAIVYLPDKPYVLTIYSKKVVNEATPKEVMKVISEKVYNYENSR